MQTTLTKRTDKPNQAILESLETHSELLEVVKLQLEKWEQFQITGDDFARYVRFMMQLWPLEQPTNN